jgi:hypothetical protein
VSLAHTFLVFSEAPGFLILIMYSVFFFLFACAFGGIAEQTSLKGECAG